MAKKDKIIDSIPNGLLVFAIIILLAFGAILGIGRMGEETKYETYANDGYGFSFSHPSDWAVNDMESQGVLMVFVSGKENVTGEKLKAGIQFYAGSLGMPPLDNLRKGIASAAENNENFTLTAGPENIAIKGAPGLDYSLEFTKSESSYRARQVILKEENSDYRVTAIARENSWKNFEPEIEHVFDSFTLLKK